MATDEIIEAIRKAATGKNWALVQYHFSELGRAFRENGIPISPAATIRLIDAVASGEPPDGAAMWGTEGNAELAAVLKELSNDPVSDDGLQKAWDTFYAETRKPEFGPEPDKLIKLLETLKGKRKFELLSRTADRVLARYPDNIRVRCLYAQALIDHGQVQAGIDLLERVTVDKLKPYDAAEVQGMIGRGHKQFYVDHVPKEDTEPRVRQFFVPHLNKAIAAYAKPYQADPKENYWHGINLVGLLRLAQADQLTGIENPTNKAPEVIAEEIVKVLEPQTVTATQPWVFSSLAEAYLARGNYEMAAKYFADYLKRGPDAFQLAGTVRQLEQVFRIKSESSGQAGAILNNLKGQLVSQPNASFSLKGDLRKLEKAATTHRESNVQGGDFLNLETYARVVRRAMAVTAMCDSDGKTQGTGFLVLAKDVHPTWGDDYVVITNNHVVNCGKWRAGQQCPDAPLTPASIKIVLRGMDNTEIKCHPAARWQSSPDVYDACILAVPKQPALEFIQPLKFCDEKMPVRLGEGSGTESGSLVSVIGYPLGGPLSLSRVNGHNGPIVDIGSRASDPKDPKYLHYQVPTEPGNSGSPVFETDKWTVVGLHHEGFNQFNGRPKLGGKSGSNFANEGISIHSIRRAIAAEVG